MYRAPTIKQHLAAIRRLLDWLVIGQVVPANPAARQRRCESGCGRRSVMLGIGRA